jgi:ribosome biogenesis GTPase A
MAAGIQWFPGHMAKARKLIADNLKMVDMVIELIDARIPISSRNPIFNDLIAGKPCLIIMNKTDLSDPNGNQMWLKAFEKAAIHALPADSLSGVGFDSIIPKTEEILADLISYRMGRGMTNRSIRVMVIGIPNVGKSSFINRISGRKSTTVEDRPGVTKGKQWIRISKNVELLDTPGILWPKFEDRNTAFNLAYTGAIRDNILDMEEVASGLLEVLQAQYPNSLQERYKIDAKEIALAQNSYDLMHEIGKKRGFFLRKGEIDLERTASIVLDEFRAGKIGRITLEWPKQQKC